jgi:hypothetical protein
MWLFELVPQYGERRVIDPKFGAYRANWLTHGILHTDTEPPIQEPEAEYLKRHGLLTYAERAG